MLREKGIEEIYDGHFYGPDDMVPVGCSDCAGCSACCRNTGDSIILDPWDMYMLSKATGKSFTDMIEQEVEIRIVDGLILPNLMQHREDRETDEEDRCPFLSEEGRCTIHPYRPGMCRMYPMGRYYPEGEEGFAYILQKDECTAGAGTPVLLRDWLGVGDLGAYEAFVLDWHAFKKSAQKAVACLTDHSRDSVTRYILQIFFVHPYLTELDFYSQYADRMEVCRKALGRIL